MSHKSDIAVSSTQPAMLICKNQCHVGIFGGVHLNAMGLFECNKKRKLFVVLGILG